MALCFSDTHLVFHRLHHQSTWILEHAQTDAAVEAAFPPVSPGRTAQVCVITGTGLPEPCHGDVSYLSVS